jgi:hypothetical protein
MLGEIANDDCSHYDCSHLVAREDVDFDPANDNECGRRTDGWTNGCELNLTRVLVGLTSPALSLLLVTVYYIPIYIEWNW